MPSFTANGAEIAYDDIRPANEAGPAMVLVHGLASSRDDGWRRSGWYAAFERRGTRVVALDLRGHGDSGKSYDPADYRHSTLARDVLALFDHLGLGQAELFGYSMGARVALHAAILAPERFSQLVLGGVGERMLRSAPPTRRNDIAEALLTDDVDAVQNRLARSFRLHADESGADRQALAACMQAPTDPPDATALGQMTMPVLVVAGEKDTVASDPPALARLFPNGRHVELAGLDHFSAIPHALTKTAVFDFLDGLLDYELTRTA